MDLFLSLKLIYSLNKCIYIILYTIFLVIKEALRIMMNDVESKAIQNKYSDEEDEAFCTKVNCFAAITIPSFLGKYSHYDKFLNSNLPPYSQIYD